MFRHLSFLFITLTITHHKRVRFSDSQVVHQMQLLNHFHLLHHAQIAIDLFHRVTNSQLTCAAHPPLLVKKRHSSVVRMVSPVIVK